jgi:hypothetical protein
LKKNISFNEKIFSTFCNNSKAKQANEILDSGNGKKNIFMKKPLRHFVTKQKNVG